VVGNQNSHSYASERESQAIVTLAEVDEIDNVAHQLNWHKFIGRILGKALYDRILVEVTFSGFFLAKVIIGLRFDADSPTASDSGLKGKASSTIWHLLIRNCITA